LAHTGSDKILLRALAENSLLYRSKIIAAPQREKQSFIHECRSNLGEPNCEVAELSGLVQPQRMQIRKMKVTFVTAEFSIRRRNG